MPFCLILRGLPGSGKTTLADLVAQVTGARICSATHYFEQNGAYQFDPNHLDDAHAFCHQQFVNALYNGDSVIIDNTNSRFFEFRRYRQMASGAEYVVIVAQIVADSDQIRALFFARNLHGVPELTFGRMAARWELDPYAINISHTEIVPGGLIPATLSPLLT